MVKTVEGILAEIDEKTPRRDDGARYLYRGEPVFYDKISSSLYRKMVEINQDIDESRESSIYLKNNTPSGTLGENTHQLLKDTMEHAPIAVTEKSLNTLEQEVLKVAKYYRKGISDNQLLAEIQHMGGKTMLVDFTSCSDVALYFACERNHPPKPYDAYDSHDEYIRAFNGRIFITTDAETPSRQVIKPGSLKPNTDAQNRIKVQKSVFIRPKQGYVELNEDDDVVEIPAALKSKIRENLRIRGIAHNTIYGDITGYVDGQDTNLHHFLRQLSKENYDRLKA